MIIGLILVVFLFLSLWTFQPHLDEYVEGEWILWYSLPFSRTNRRYIKL